MVFAPVEVAVTLKLQAVRMIHRVVCKFALKLTKIETGLYFLNFWRFLPENPIHPPIDLESILSPVEQAADRDFGLVRILGLGSFLLHADVDFLPVRSRASIP